MVAKILAQPDDTVEVGQALAQIDPNGAGDPATAPTAPSRRRRSETDGLVDGRRRGRRGPRRRRGRADVRRSPASDTDADRRRARLTSPATPPDGEAEQAGGTSVVSMPEMGESVTEGTVLEWH